MNDPCEKLILAEGLGVRLIYCKNCDVIELELGAISMRLNPNHVQQIANVMMKASLRLDRMVNLNNSPADVQTMQHLH
jgi:hypothetical protein